MKWHFVAFLHCCPKHECSWWCLFGLSVSNAEQTGCWRKKLVSFIFKAWLITQGDEFALFINSAATTYSHTWHELEEIWAELKLSSRVFMLQEKILHGKLRSPDYANTVNGMSANSILLVKLFYTLEPLGPTKISGKDCCKGGAGQIGMNITQCGTVQPLQWVQVHSMDWFLPEQLLWKPCLHLVGDREVVQEGSSPDNHR